MRRILIVVVLFAASGTASYLIWHARQRPARAPRADVTRRGSGGGTATGGTPARPDPRPPTLPVLPRHVDDPDAGVPPPPSPPPSGLSQTFEQEPRDAAWAGDTEREMTLRLKRVIADLARHGGGVDIDGVECHRTLCRIAIHAASDAALSRLYGALETTEGLYGWADTVLLTRIDVGLDGKLTTAAIAQFDRE